MALQPQEGFPQEFDTPVQPEEGQGAVVLEFRRVLPPGMTAALADLAWSRANTEAGYGMAGIAEFKRDENGLYVDQHGQRVYLA